MKRSPFTILPPTSARFCPEQVAVLDRAAAIARASRSDLLRQGALQLAHQIINDNPGVAV